MLISNVNTSIFGFNNGNTGVLQWLESKSDAREEAKAMRATVTKKLTPFFIASQNSLSLGEGWEILHGVDINL